MEDNNQISKLGGSSFNELGEISKSIESYVSSNNNATLQVAIEKMNNTPGFWKRLFPDKYTKKMDEISLSKIEDIALVNKRMYEIHSEVQLEIARQQGDALIMATSVHLRDKITKFVLDKIDNMTINLKDGRNNFMKLMAEQMDTIEEYKRHPELAEDYRQSLTDERKMYFSFVKTLLKEFQTALNNKISS